MTTKKTKRLRANTPRREKSLSEVVGIIHRARIEAALDKIAIIREQITILFVRSQQGHLSSLSARTLAQQLQQELARTVCSLESWQFRIQGRV